MAELLGLAEIQPPRDKKRPHDGSFASNSNHSWSSMIDPGMYRDGSLGESSRNTLQPEDWEGLVGSLTEEDATPSSQHGVEPEMEANSISGLATKLDRSSTHDLAGGAQAKNGDMRVKPFEWARGLGLDETATELDDVKLSSNESVPMRGSGFPASQGIAIDGTILDPEPIFVPSPHLRESES